MSRFLRNILLFSIVPVVVLIYTICQVDGRTDPFYLRFTTPAQSSLILGTSRAAQGLQPAVLTSILKMPIFNYSFTLLHSPYGPAYYSSILRKLEPSENGLFILSVDPWSISTRAKDPNNINQFEERGKLLERIRNVNVNPNLEYLLSGYQKQYYRIFQKSKFMELQPDGWLNVNVSMDNTSTQKRTTNKLRQYKEEHLKNFHYSPVRMKYLEKTINTLKHYGEVYLVRLPIHPDLQKVEDELMPDFNRKMAHLAGDSLPYLDLTTLNSTFEYTDGNHLFRKSGKEVSRIIGEWIKENRIPTN